jgi:hypothetical protein
MFRRLLILASAIPLQSMIRRLSSIAVLLSLLVCVAMCWLWARSTWVADEITRYESDHVYELESNSGRLIVSRSENTAVRVAESKRRLMAELAPSAAKERDEAEIRNLLRRAAPHWQRRTLPAGDRIPPLMSSPLHFGFGCARELSYGDLWEHGVWIIMPHWALAGMTAVLPAIWVARRCRAAGRKRRGHCPTCGYEVENGTVTIGKLLQ